MGKHEDQMSTHDRKKVYGPCVGALRQRQPHDRCVIYIEMQLNQSTMSRFLHSRQHENIIEKT
jgi:hypothetical protein